MTSNHYFDVILQGEVMTYKSFSESPHYIMEVGKHKSKPLIFCQGELQPCTRPDESRDFLVLISAYRI